MPQLSGPAVVPVRPLVAQFLAQADGPVQRPADIRDVFVQTLPIALIVLAAYMLLLRPERERARKQQAILAGIKKNDRVLTSAGLFGTVANVDRDAGRVVLKVDDAANVKITVTLASVTQVLGEREGGDAAEGVARP